MKSKGLALVTLGLALVLLFAVNIVAGRLLAGSRIDLTENRVYTLSEGTLNVLRKLEEPITLRLYLSESLATGLPSIASYANRVKELLREYERIANGKVRLHVIDPEPFSEEEDRAVGYGLRGLALGDGEEAFYFGLVGTSSTDEEEVIPFLSPSREQFLEYDITKLVYNLARPEQPVVGLLSTLPIEGAGPRAALQGLSSPPWMVVTQMQQLFKVRSIAAQEESLPDDLDVLMLVHPKNLSRKLLYAIDQFVMRGGRLLVFVDPNSDSEQTMMMGGMMPPPGSRASYLDELLPAYGVRLERDRVVADLGLAQTVRMERQGRIITFQYPVWINVRPDLVDGRDPITAQLGNLAFGTPGSLVAVEGAGTELHPLVLTTEQAAKFEVSMVGLGADPQDLLRKYEPGGKPLTLAARVTGKAKSAFPDGPPPPEKEEAGDAAGDAGTGSGEGGATKPHLAESEGDVNIVVVADTDLLNDRFWVNVQEILGSRLAVPTAANGDFLINALDNLTGSSDLIKVRNRGSFTRPFERIEALQREAELQFRRKEQELSRQLAETERRLSDLEEGKQGDESVVLSEAQQKELVRFRQERLRIRKELREVRRNLRRDIDRLESWVKFVNIGLMPIAVALGGVLIGLWRVGRRRGLRPA